MIKIIEPTKTYDTPKEILDKLAPNQRASKIREYENGDLQYDIETDKGDLQLNPLFEMFNALALPTTAIANAVSNQRQDQREQDMMIEALQPQVINNYENIGLANRVQPYAEEGGMADVPKGFDASIGMIPADHPNYINRTGIVNPFPAGDYSLYRTDYNKKYIPYGYENKDKAAVNKLPKEKKTSPTDKIKLILDNIFTSDEKQQKINKKTDELLGNVEKKSYINNDFVGPPEYDFNDYISPELKALKAQFDKIVYAEDTK